ncbi:MAG: aldo/keto reductase [Candidatus Sumerlaeia bacterium]|nr:aldo/keto reductase [Candidatus Sumerlaeia bacterium]
MRRRDFFKAAAAAAAFPHLVPASETAPAIKAASSSNAAQLQKRPYGKTGLELSIIGFSGLMLNRMEQADCNRIVAEAFERGVNYYDVAPAYGSAEVKLGPALEPYRKKIILGCKTKARTREEAEAEFKRSLERLKTDYFDIYQFHHLVSIERDVDRIFGAGGAMEFFQTMKKEGRIRFIGFSAHTVESAMAALDRYQFDHVMFPFNFASMLKAGFGTQVMEKALKKGVCCLAIKPGVRGKWPSEEVRKASPNSRNWYQPLETREEAEWGYRFTLSRPVTVAMPPADATLFRMALDIGNGFRPLVGDEEAKVKEMAMAVEDPLFPRDEK